MKWHVADGPTGTAAEGKHAVGMRPPGKALASIHLLFRKNVLQSQRPICIRGFTHEPIRVGDVVANGLVSRRGLEMRFKTATNSTLQDEIWRAHVDRARQLLLESDKPMWKIAEESGFLSETVFCVMFKRTTGMTPSAYRRSHGGQMMPF